MAGGEVEGLSGALRRGGEDLRYPLGSAQPLTDLAQDFAHSANHRRKIAELSRHGYGYMRRVRGDGNCFYRAMGFAWLEALDGLAGGASSSRAPVEALPCGWPDEAGFGSLAAEYKELRQEVARAGGSSGLRALLQRLLCDVRLDLCLVILVRRVVAGFFERGACGAASADGTVGAILETVAAEYGSLANFAVAQVLPLGQEAEGAAIAVAARELGARLRIVQLDGSPGPMPSYVYPSEDYVSRLGVRICLLFRPGHYEVLYREDAPRFREGPSLRGLCSFCWEVSSLPSDGLLPCFHRLCATCTAQSRRRGANLQCPICSEVPLVSNVRPAWQPQTSLDLPRAVPGGAACPPRTSMVLGGGAAELPEAQPRQECWPQPPALGTGHAVPQTQLDIAGAGWSQATSPSATGAGALLAGAPRSEAYLLRQRLPSKGAEASGSPVATSAPHSDPPNTWAAAMGSALAFMAFGGTESSQLPNGQSKAALDGSPSAGAGLRVPGTAVLAAPRSAAAQAAPDRPPPSSSPPDRPPLASSPPEAVARAPRTSLLLPSGAGGRACPSASSSAASPMAGPSLLGASPLGASPLGASSLGGSPVASSPLGAPPVAGLGAGGSMVPQTEVSLAGYHAPKPSTGPSPARCLQCSARDQLRRVRCCGVHFCHSCLSDMITSARSGAPLRCLNCRAAWDLEQLSRAWLAVAPSRGSAQPVAAA